MIRKYLELEAEEVHKSLIQEIGNAPKEAEKLLEELEASERYEDDHEFRAVIETAKLYLLVIEGKYSEVIGKALKLVEVITALELWSLRSFNLNLIANFYSVHGIYERALEYYYYVIDNENKHNLGATLPLVYNNLGLIFLNLNIHDRAVKYFELSIETLEKGGKNQFRYNEKMVNQLSNLIIAHYNAETGEDVKPIFDKIESFDLENINRDILPNYYIAKMYYNFFTGNYSEAKRYFKLAEVQRPGDVLYIALMRCNFVDMAVRFKREDEFYIEELMSLKEIPETGSEVADVKIHTELKRYYERKCDKEELDKINMTLLKLMEKENEMLHNKQKDSIQIVEDIFLENKNLVNNEYKDREFRLIANETIKNRNELQKAYNRLEMIHEIGIKLASTHELEEVIDTIYKNIKANVPVDAFVILVAEPEFERLRSLICYKREVVYPEFTIAFDEEESAFMSAYKKNTIVSSSDKDFKFIYIDENSNLNRPDDGKFVEEGGMKSSLFIPLKLGDKTLGVYSVQSAAENAYENEQLEFLEEFQPYLVIALNNAMYSWKLEGVIEQHVQTQDKLEFANKKLNKMASLDSLTQISNRRDFEAKFKSLLEESDSKKTSMCVCMFDIDDFKKYNDTYGHFAGDEVLKKVADVINKNIGNNKGIAARFGGEEFIGACIGLSLEEISDMVEKIRQEVYELNIENEKGTYKKLTISIGAAVSIKLNTPKKSYIMRRADEMLYEAKNTGKNKACIKLVE